MSWAETIRVQIVTSHKPNCHDPTICFPCKLKQTLKQGTNAQQPTKIHLSARPLGKGNTVSKWQRKEMLVHCIGYSIMCSTPLQPANEWLSGNGNYSILKHMWMTTKHTKTILVKKEHYIKFDLLSSDTTPPSSWIFSLYITCRTCSCCQIRLSSFFWSAMVIVYLVNDAVIHSFTGAKVFRTSDVPSNLFNRFTNVSWQQLNLSAN